MTTANPPAVSAPSPVSRLLSFSDVEAARARIADAVLHTPTTESRTLGEMVGARVFLKFENLQFTAAYKERGALN
ncbi:MAG: threonine ammonia-lyase, partial [Sphingopyxis sp.]